jgi:hypothetical protein
MRGGQVLETGSAMGSAMGPAVIPSTSSTASIGSALKRAPISLRSLTRAVRTLQGTATTIQDQLLNLQLAINNVRNSSSLTLEEVPPDPRLQMLIESKSSAMKKAGMALAQSDIVASGVLATSGVAPSGAVGGRRRKTRKGSRKGRK